MSDNIRIMIDLAQKALKNSYSPYSNFPVGCCIESTDGNYYIGCNVENAAYPSGFCAEPGAISQMIVDGGKKIKSIVLVDGIETACPPCGSCRQRLSEFSDENTMVYLCNNSGILESYKLFDLLTHSFNAKSMEK